MVTGRRPGEKLHEELFTEDERPSPTRNAKILSACPSEVPRPALMRDVDGLLAAARARDWAAIDMRMSALFPNYQPPGTWQAIRREAPADARMLGEWVASADDPSQDPVATPPDS